MSLDESIEVFEKAIGFFENGLKDVSEEMAMSTMGLIVNRIQQEGLEGRSYSNNKLPNFYFEGRALNGGGRALLKKKIKKGEQPGISYKEWREANGLQVAHVDLTYSGRMFQNLGIVGTTKQGDAFVTIVGGFDKEVKDKLRWNAQRFGDFFMVTNKEKEILSSVYHRRVSEELQKLLS